MGLHLFDSGLRLARRTAIRQAIVAAIEELTANWTELASAGEADRELAIARHAPAVYQSELVEVLMGRDR